MSERLPLNSPVRVARDTVSLVGTKIAEGTLGFIETWGPRGFHGVRIESGDFFCLPTPDLELT